MDLDGFGIPKEFSTQVESVSLRQRVSLLQEQYFKGKLSWPELNTKVESLTEGKFKELVMDADVLIPTVVDLSPDDKKKFKLKEKLCRQDLEKY